MTHEFSFSFDRAFIHDAFKRDLIWVYVVIALAAAMIFGAFISYSWPPDVVTGAIFGGGWLLIVVMMVFKYRKGLDRVYDVWKQQSPSQTMAYVLDDEGVEVGGALVEGVAQDVVVVLHAVLLLSLKLQNHVTNEVTIGASLRSGKLKSNKFGLSRIKYSK